MTGRSGSFAQNTSAWGWSRSATTRRATPGLFVSSVSYTARTLIPLIFSKSLSTGSENTWSSEVYTTTSWPDRWQATVSTATISTASRNAVRRWLPCMTLMELRDVLPANVLHECIHILCRCRTVIQVIGVFVHVEGKDHVAPREAVRMIGRPLIDEPTGARRMRQEHPTRASAHGLTHGDKLRAPAFERAEI